MNFIILLALTVIIQKSRSQMLTTDLDCFENGVRLVIMCVTTDFAQGINFYLNGVDQGGCFPSVGCTSAITQSVDTTSFAIASFSDSTNSGNWTCTYGVSTSNALAIAVNPCIETTEGPIEGIKTTEGSIEGIETTEGPIEGNASSENSINLTPIILAAVGALFSIMIGIMVILLIKRRMYTHKSGSPSMLKRNSRKRKDRFDLKNMEVPTLLVEDQTNDEVIKIVTELKNQKGITKVTDEASVKETVSVIDEKNHKETGTVTKLIPQDWMLYLNTIDSELPRAFEWINDNGDNFAVTKNNYTNKETKKPVSTDNGIYQLVRTLEDGTKDSINVVLHVTDHLPCTLLVDPNFWNEVEFYGKEPKTLKTLIASKTDTTKIQEEYEVEWKFRSRRFTKFESFGENSKSKKGQTVEKKKDKTSLKLTSNRTKRYRQYRCTVSFKTGRKQIYFFIVKVLGENQSLKKGGHNIVGVPNILKDKGEFYYFAYGSNLLKQRLLVKNKNAEFVAKAELKGYKLDFISLKEPANSTWKGGVANIIPSTDDSVWGVIWKLNVENIPSLDGQEATYEAINVKLIVEKNEEICRTYLIDPTKASKELNHTPSPQYLHIIVLGAQGQMLPLEYIQKLEKIPHNANTENIKVYEKLMKEMNIENTTQRPESFNPDEEAEEDNEL